MCLDAFKYGKLVDILLAENETVNGQAAAAAAMQLVNRPSDVSRHPRQRRFHEVSTWLSNAATSSYSHIQSTSNIRTTYSIHDILSYYLI